MDKAADPFAKGRLEVGDYKITIRDDGQIDIQERAGRSHRMRGVIVTAEEFKTVLAGFFEGPSDG